MLLFCTAVANKQVRLPKRLLGKRRLPKHAGDGLGAGGNTPRRCRGGFQGDVRMGHAGGVIDMGLTLRVWLRLRLLVGGKGGNTHVTSQHIHA